MTKTGRISIVIPTRNRIEKLRRTLDSIPGRCLYGEIEVIVVCDGDKKSFDSLRDNPRINRAVLVAAHRGAVYCRNIVTQQLDNPFIYATDDIVFLPGAIKNAELALREHFPDNDGVIGFMQTGNKFHPTGVALVGETFLYRYPEKKLFFPEYYHFACQEIHWLAEKLGKFYQCQSAIVQHFHPINMPEEMDRTHVEARIFKDEDMKLKAQREATGLIWGDG